MLTTLIQKVPDFHMDTFLEELNEKRNELDGDVFEMLYTLSGEQTSPQKGHNNELACC